MQPRPRANMEASRKPIRLLLVFLSAILVPNAVLVILKTTTNRRAPTKIVEEGCDCGSRDTGESVGAPRPSVDYSRVALETPHIANKTKYSRLASTLTLDYSRMCPHGSLMLEDSNRRSQFVPEHLNCPSLFIVGARKAGTSSLYMYLSRHPSFKGILLDRGSRVGETYYFSSRWKKWKWRQYMKLFEHTGGYTTGESSVGYLVSCSVPRRLWRSCGKQAKIVVLLRDPVERFESNYRMRIQQQLRGYSNFTRASTVVNFEVNRFLSTALKNGAIEQAWEKFRCLFNPSGNMIYEGIYYVHVMNWLCNFLPENILILNSEEFFHNTAAVFEEVIEFLGLPPLDPNTTSFITSTAYNSGKGGVQGLSEMDRKKLRTVYKHTNQPLLRLLGWNDLEWS